MAISISCRFARIGLLERTCDAHDISVLIQWSDAQPRQSIRCYINKAKKNGQRLDILHPLLSWACTFKGWPCVYARSSLYLPTWHTTDRHRYAIYMAYRWRVVGGPKMYAFWDGPLSHRERSGSVVECLTRDRRAAGLSLTGVTALCPWARPNAGITQEDPSRRNWKIVDWNVKNQIKQNHYPMD